MLLEARAGVGGVAASERFAGATVNICNCDHVTFRTTPIADELDLAHFGLRYLDIDPAQVGTAWSSGPPWRQWHDVERTIEELGATHPSEVDGYRRYLRTARPAVELIAAAAIEPPTLTGLTRVGVRRRLAGVPGLLRWGRRSAADGDALVLHATTPCSVRRSSPARWSGASAPSGRAPGSAR